MQLNHRIVLAPLTRLRNTPSQVPIPDVVKEYYSQRASTPGTLLISEAVFISPKAAGFGGVSGIWTDEQIQGWKEVRFSSLDLSPMTYHDLLGCQRSSC